MVNSMEHFLWQQIENMNFNQHGYKGASKYLITESSLTLKGMREVHDFAVNKVCALYDKLTDIQGVSDDSFSDLCWQIVANGEEFYNNITLDKAQEMADNYEYTESFAYAFHDLDDIELDVELQNRDMVKQMEYLEGVRSGMNGGGFMQKLVAAFDHADNGNKRKLALGFPELFEHLVD